MSLFIATSIVLDCVARWVTAGEPLAQGCTKQKGQAPRSNAEACTEVSRFIDKFVDMCVALPAAGAQIWSDGPMQRPPSRLPAVKRLLSLGDLHGDYSKAQSALRLAGIIDDQDRWAAGTATVIQVGDQLDRGGNEIAILLLLERLQQQAAAVGGAFYPINGNHETLNVEGSFRYVDNDGFREFHRWHWFYDLGQRLKRKCGLDAPRLKGLTPEEVEDTQLPGYIHARYVALRPGGIVTSRFLANQNTVMTVGSSVFAHGGLLPEHVDHGLDEINAETSSWMRGLIPKEPRFLRGRNAIVWSRHFSKDPCENCALLGEVLEQLNVSRLVVGHTIQDDGITSACDGGVYRVDVGLSKGCGDGEPQVLEILNDHAVRVIAPDGGARAPSQRERVRT